MAITGMHIECDYCEKTTTEFEDVEEAAEGGWFFLTGPDPGWDEESDEDGWQELAYCSMDCLKADLP